MDIDLILLVIAGVAGIVIAVFLYWNFAIEITIGEKEYVLHHFGNQKRFDKEFKELKEAILRVGIEAGVEYGLEEGFKQGWEKGCDAMREKIIQGLKLNEETTDIGTLIEGSYALGRDQGFEQAMKSVEGLDLDAIIKGTREKDK